MSSRYVAARIEEFLDAVAAREAAPGGGAVAAIVTAAAASLAAMAARFATEPAGDGADLARAADRIRVRAGQLADADAAAYRAVLDAYALPRSGDPAARRERISAALWQATEIPVRIAELGAEVAGLAGPLLEAGNRRLAGDAYAAIALAEAAVRAAATLVRINAHAGGLGAELVNRADRAVRAADQVGRQAAALIDGRYPKRPIE